MERWGEGEMGSRVTDSNSGVEEKLSHGINLTSDRNDWPKTSQSAATTLSASAAT